MRFKKLLPQMTNDSVSILSSQLTAQISTVDATAQQSLEDGAMNTAAIGTINTMLASQLPFAGAAASVSSLQVRATRCCSTSPRLCL